MKKKNSSLIKWILGVTLALSLVVFATNQQMQAKDRGIFLYLTRAVAHNHFFQYLERMFGFGYLITASDLSPDDQGENQFNHAHGHNSNIFEDLEQNVISFVEGLFGKSNTAQNNGNNSKYNTANNPGSFANQGAGSGSDTVTDQGSGAGSESGDRTTMNAENNAEYNGQNNAESNAETGSENNSENNSESNSTGNAENNSGGNAETNADQGSGSTGSINNPGNNPGNNNGNGSSNNSGDNSGNNQGSNVNYANLPEMNPIPSDSSVAQGTADQNQANNAMAAMLASRKELVEPVVQQAQAAKYQTVNAQNNLVPSTDPPPADVQAKVNAHQLTLH